jgi:predicted DNA-binding WGR domain protein
MDVDALLPGFTYLLFERINPAENEARFYYIAWEPTLFEAGAVVRIYGRKGGRRRVMAPVPYPSLEAAWSFIRAIIRRRLRHGYKLIKPASTERTLYH